MEREFDFSEALLRLKAGGVVRRKAWQLGEHLVLQEPSADRSKQPLGRVTPMTEPYIYKRAAGRAAPWTPSQGELLVTDWQEPMADAAAAAGIPS